MHPKQLIRIAIIVWTVVWLILVGLLIWNWKSWPMYVTLPLFILEAIFVPDIEAIKKHVFNIDYTNAPNKEPE